MIRVTLERNKMAPMNVKPEPSKTVRALRLEPNRKAPDVMQVPNTRAPGAPQAPNRTASNGPGPNTTHLGERVQDAKRPVKGGRLRTVLRSGARQRRAPMRLDAWPDWQKASGA
jgi:hypothetical protein